MAISVPHYHALRELSRAGELPQGGAILEIGEANFYGDLPLSEIQADIDSVPDAVRRAELTMDLEGAEKSALSLFAIAKVVYSLFCSPNQIAAIDIHGTSSALRIDLNHPIRLDRQFEIVINHGTAEHIFNIANVFKVMHDHCSLGGLMIHEAPFTGWIDHGFYNLNPTLFYDVAAANEYEIVYMAIEQVASGMLKQVESREQIHDMARNDELPDSALLYVAMRKKTDAPFLIPMQGYYDQTLSTEAQESWRKLR